MEQIYTIPIYEAFEAHAENHELGCPFCALYRKFENDELELILGASMMEPDIRIQTNKQGFCKTHYDMMFVRKNRLGMALTLESHLAEIRKEISDGAMASLTGNVGINAIRRLNALESDCYVCTRVESHFSRMMDNAVYLWESEEKFRDLLSKQPFLCLMHYKTFLEHGKARLSKKKYTEFAKQTSSIVETYFDSLCEDVSWFCKKFDYRYGDEPWYNSKDAVERAMKFLKCDIHRPESPKDKK